MPARRKVVTTEEYQSPEAPPQPSGEYPDEDVFEYMAAIPQEERANTKIYVYQVEPSVSRVEGAPAYLKIFSGESPFTYEDLKKLAPQAVRFRSKIFRPNAEPKIFPNIFVAPQAVQPVPQKPVPAEGGPELVTLLKDMIDKSNSGAGVDQLKESFHHIQEMMRTSYTESLRTIAQQKPEGEAGMIDKLIKLGLLKTGNDQGGILETVGVLKQLGLIGEKREDVFDQIEKLKTMGELLGWSTGGHGGGEDDWRISLAKNAPDILGGIERVTLNIVQAIQQARVPAGTVPPPALNPANAAAARAAARADSPTDSGRCHAGGSGQPGKKQADSVLQRGN